MESFEFLGGRYNRPEQIMSGPVQAFKAQNAANGRTVFIHRVSTTEAPAEQAALLKLLTTALVKSAEAKRLVLDFGEESGYWYVVTESEPQCALLREWLQLEIDAAFAGSHQAAKVPAAPPASAATQKADPGEFTRFLQRPGTGPQVQRPSSAGTPPAFVPPPVSPLKPATPPPGEFTSFFNAGKETPQGLVIPRGPEVPLARDLFLGERVSGEPAQKQEPGEFTRFFTPGLPQVPPKQTGASNQYVQRPNSPPPPVLPVTPVKPNEPGEFTRMFSHPDGAQQGDSRPASFTPPSFTPQGVRGDPMGFAKQPSNQLNDLSDNLFNDKIEVGRPLTSSQPQQGEFTKIFGAVGSEAPQIKPQGVVAQQRDQPLLDEAQSTRQLPTTRPQPPGPPPTLPGSPSEFTMIMQGGYKKPDAEQSSAGSAGSPLSVNLAPLGSAVPNLGGASGSIAGMHGNVSQHGASVGSALGSAHLQAPPPDLKILKQDKAAANKKLMLFFVVLGVLALVLIAVVMFLMKSK